MMLSGWQRVGVAGGAAILTVAVGYSQVCSLACTLASCIELAKHDESGEHSEHTKSPPESPAPSDSDCIRHGHPDSFVQPASQSFPTANFFGPDFISLPVSIVKERSAAPVTVLLDHNHSAPTYLVHDPLYLSLSCLRI